MIKEREIIMITRKLENWEKAELKYKTKIQEKINNYYFSCEWSKITDYFLANGDLKHCPLWNICQHYYYSNLANYPSLNYWSVEDYFSEVLTNFWLTLQNQAYGDEFTINRVSAEDIGKTYYTNIDELDFYSSIIAHCKYILLEYVEMTKKDKVRINYSSNSLEQMQEVMGDNLQYLTLGEATWTPQFCEEQKTKGKRGRKKGSKNKKNRKDI